MLTDTHCHLNLASFVKDRDEVLSRAREKGVTRILTPGTDLPSSRLAIELSKTYPEVYAAVGVHPNEARTWNSSSLAELRELARSPKVVAIGEIGLDYYRDWAPRRMQQDIFTQQLQLAAELSLPVVIHVRNASAQERRAMSDMLSMLSEWYSGLKDKAPNLVERPGVLHSFSDDLSAARQAFEMRFRIGITGPVTFPNAAALCEVVTNMPMESLLIETDAPFLTPMPHRGDRNEPAYVHLIADKIAKLRKASLVSIASATTANAGNLFHW